MDETAVDVKMTTILYIYTKKCLQSQTKINMAPVSGINKHNQEKNVLVFWDLRIKTHYVVGCCDLETRPTLLTSFAFAVANNSQQKYTFLFLQCVF